MQIVFRPVLNRAEFLRDGGCDVLQERFSSHLSCTIPGILFSRFPYQRFSWQCINMYQLYQHLPQRMRSLAFVTRCRFLSVSAVAEPAARCIANLAMYPPCARRTLPEVDLVLVKIHHHPLKHPIAASLSTSACSPIVCISCIDSAYYMILQYITSSFHDHACMDKLGGTPGTANSCTHRIDILHLYQLPCLQFTMQSGEYCISSSHWKLGKAMKLEGWIQYDTVLPRVGCGWRWWR